VDHVDGSERSKDYTIGFSDERLTVEKATLINTVKQLRELFVYIVD